MKKIKLHWQILIALILAIAFGIMFPSSYMIREKSYKSLNRSITEPVVFAAIEMIEGDEYQTRAEFNEALAEILSPEMAERYSITLADAAYHNPHVRAVSWMGDIFLRALKMIIIPLILSSLISGVTNIGTGGNLGRLGLKTLSYYILTSTFAIITGLFFVNMIKPGTGADLNFSQHVEGLVESQRSLGETLINIIPTNIFEAFSNSAMLSIIFFAILFGFFITRIKNPHRDIL
ncbi:MAG: cation:dicarboxylase symporter family transporter, partial [Bacteroidales bacterium]|nr:cation:dicarboxylase symporter family transporter [Bacteroidales bacterium]